MSEEQQTVTVDGNEYNLDDLSETAKAIVGHVISIRQEVGEVSHRLVTLQAAELQLSRQLSTELESEAVEGTIVEE
tara:strand:+ start:5412 stop:5639 length:228 start_codon:yes stop_codon:yes gene_type:complete